MSLGNTHTAAEKKYWGISTEIRRADVAKVNKGSSSSKSKHRGGSLWHKIDEYMGTATETHGEITV